MGHARVLLDFRVRTAHTDRYEEASKYVLVNVESLSGAWRGKKKKRKGKDKK